MSIYSSSTIYELSRGTEIKSVKMKMKALVLLSNNVNF